MINQGSNTYGSMTVVMSVRNLRDLKSPKAKDIRNICSYKHSDLVDKTGITFYSLGLIFAIFVVLTLLTSLTGEMPSELGSLSNLEILRLGSNLGSADDTVNASLAALRRLQGPWNKIVTT